jgi:hypothetical protein
MSALGKLRTIEGSRLGFWCPGCKEMHVVTIGPGGWTWNGDPDRPTIRASVLVRGGHYAPGSASAKTGKCWCTYNAEHPDDPAPFKCTQCHSFVTDGRIQFLGDCTHELAGQTVDLPMHPENEP